MSTISNGTFASFRQEKRSKGSQISAPSILTPAHPTTAAMTRQQQKAFYEQQKKEAKEIWGKRQSSIRNDWQWPSPPKAHGQIDITKCYTERVVSTPDETILDVTTVATLKRKRKIRAGMLGETKWNHGLRTFEQRRKAWTGSVDVYLPLGNTLDHSRVKFMRDSPLEMLAAIQDDLKDDESDDSSAIGKMTKGYSNIDPAKSKLGTTLIPFYVPILPGTLSLTQPLPNGVPEITLYKNLVTDGKTAVAPIPLANVVKACVTGLKNAEEWPPRPGMSDPLPGRVNREKRRSRIKSLFGIKKDVEISGTTRNSNELGAFVGEAGFESWGF